MADGEGALVFGWRDCAARARVSERYVRQLARERGLVVDRRADGAVGIAAAALDALAAELQKANQREATPAPALVAAALPTAAPAATPCLEVIAPADAQAVAPQTPSSATSTVDEGVLAASVFSAFASGRTMRETVVDLKITPEVVRDLNRRWQALEVADGLATESAEKRLARLDQVVEGYAERLERRERLDGRVCAELLQRVSGLQERVTALERRVAGDGTRHLARNLEQRLAQLESAINTQPTDLIAIDRRCDHCGAGPLVVAAGCARCGRGMTGSAQSPAG
jgi:hypothetical protein